MTSHNRHVNVVGICAILFSLSGWSTARASHRYELDWVRQNSQHTLSNTIGIDASGEAYVSSYSGGGLDTSKFSGSGDTLWSSWWRADGGFFDSPGDYTSLAVDPSGSYIYICGMTHGYVDGVPAGATNEANPFLSRLDSDGTILWSRGWGTLEMMESAEAVSLDAEGNAYVVSSGSYARSPAIRKYSASGELQWEQPLTGRVGGVEVDSDGSIYIAGDTRFADISGDAFLSKLNSDGHELWTQVADGLGVVWFGDMLLDQDGHVYVAGTSMVDAVSEEHDPFLLQFDKSGSLLWTRQQAMPLHQNNASLAINHEGDVVISGFTSFAGDRTESYLVAYDGAGDVTWTDTLNLSGVVATKVLSMAFDSNGDLFACGQTVDDGGGSGAFVAKFQAMPEPATLALTGLVCLLALRKRGRPGARSW